MRRSLSTTSVGLSVSAVLAVIYILVLFSGLLLAGLGTSQRGALIEHGARY